MVEAKHLRQLSQVLSYKLLEPAVRQWSADFCFKRVSEEHSTPAAISLFSEVRLPFAFNNFMSY